MPPTRPVGSSSAGSRCAPKVLEPKVYLPALGRPRTGLFMREKNIHGWNKELTVHQGTVYTSHVGATIQTAELETICQMCQLMQTRVYTSCFLIKTTRTLVFSDICAKYVFSPLKQRPLYTCVAPSGTTEEMLVCIFGNPGNAIVCCLNYFTGSRSVICSEETAHQVFPDKSKWVGQPGNLATWQWAA